MQTALVDQPETDDLLDKGALWGMPPGTVRSTGQLPPQKPSDPDQFAMNFGFNNLEDMVGATPERAWDVLSPKIGGWLGDLGKGIGDLAGNTWKWYAENMVGPNSGNGSFGGPLSIGGSLFGLLASDTKNTAAAAIDSNSQMNDLGESGRNISYLSTIADNTTIMVQQLGRLEGALLGMDIKLANILGQLYDVKLGAGQPANLNSGGISGTGGTMANVGAPYLVGV